MIFFDFDAENAFLWVFMGINAGVTYFKPLIILSF